MPTHDVTITAGATLEAWADPARPAATQGPSDPGAPSRLNPTDFATHKRWVGTNNSPITLAARLRDGTVAPLDSALGGDLFVWWLVEFPAGGVTGITLTASQSSEATLTPVRTGHYLIGCRRPNNGACLLHLDVDD